MSQLLDAKTQEYIRKLNAPLIDTHTFWACSGAKKTAWDILAPKSLDACLRLLGVYGIGIPMAIADNKSAPDVVNKSGNIIATHIHYNPSISREKQMGYISPDEVDRLSRNAAVIGFKTIPALTHTPVNGTENNPFYEVASRHGLPVLVHCSGSGNEFSDVRQFQDVVDTFPGLRVILAHFGGLRTDYMKRAVNFAEGNKNIFLNTTSLNPFRNHPRASNKKYTSEEAGPSTREFFEDVLGIFIDAAQRIPDRIIFGTDLGIFRIENYSLWPVYELHDARIESRILYENPLRLFPRLSERIHRTRGRQ